MIESTDELTYHRPGALAAACIRLAWQRLRRPAPTPELRAMARAVNVTHTTIYDYMRRIKSEYRTKMGVEYEWEAPE